MSDSTTIPFLTDRYGFRLGENIQKPLDYPKLVARIGFLQRVKLLLFNRVYAFTDSKSFKKPTRIFLAKCSRHQVFMLDYLHGLRDGEYCNCPLCLEELKPSLTAKPRSPLRAVTLSPTLILNSENLVSVFVDSVDSTLRGILGNMATDAFYLHLQKEYFLTKQDIFNSLREFIEELRIIFEKSSPTIERAIARRLYSQLGLPFVERPKEVGLDDYVDDAFQRATRLTRKVLPLPDETWKTLDFAKDLAPHDHVILFYSEPKLKRRLLFPYLKAAIDNGEAAVYVASQETPERIRQAMKEAGIDVEWLEVSGALYVISFTESYYLHGHFDIVRTTQFWEKLYSKVIAQGFKGLQVIREMHRSEHGQLNELEAYEQSLHEHLDLPITGICAYDINQVPITTLHDLIAAHSKSLILGPELQLKA